MSDSLYTHDEAAQIVTPWDEAFRAQRDVALSIPINYLTVPAVSLQAACFAHNQYENKAFQKCFSNLLAVGFRRYLIDVYWDPNRAVWSLCPVQVPSTDAESEDQAPAAIFTVPLPSSPAGRRDGLAERAETCDVPPLSTVAHVRHRRQDGPSSSSDIVSSSSSIQSSEASSTASEEASSSSASPTPSFTAFPTDGLPVVQIGAYNCTTLMTLDFLTGIFEDFLDATDTTTAASISYFLFNIRTALSYNALGEPAQKPSSDQLPQDGSFVSDIVKGNLSDALYTPNDLQNDRQNLNNSWYNVHWENLPAAGYFQTSVTPKGHLITEDGWPTEAFMEFKKFYRLIAGFASIDRSMEDYNITADEDTIFPVGELRAFHDTSISPSGVISSGCLFDSSDTSISSSRNSSWALSSAPTLNIGTDPNTTTPILSITNLTSCGLSPFLNASLSNSTADQAPVPYLAYTHSTLWSWAPGEPTGELTNQTVNRGARYIARCATTQSTYPYPGRWRTVNCDARYRVACQDRQNPYTWAITDDTSTYFNAESACKHPYTFSVPHTPLENAHLLAALQNHHPSSSPSAKPADPIYINLNSLDVQGCWVPQVNGTCPYLPRTDKNNTRVVVIPTVAAVIIFVLAVLTFFIKCASNRQKGRRGRRRRMVGGWEYEGVP
ncbi:hypothetical protein EJ04DRAFT_514039, partial [Polyplosphaeria fusca]